MNIIQWFTKPTVSRFELLLTVAYLVAAHKQIEPFKVITVAYVAVMLVSGFLKERQLTK